jgi:hypothetical protein
MQAMLILEPGADVDPDELDQLTAELRRRLLDELDINAADPAVSKQVPESAKPIVALTVGTLVITLSPVMLHSVVHLIQAWIENHPIRSAKVTVGSDSIEVTDVTRADQRRLIDSFIERHVAE